MGGVGKPDIIGRGTGPRKRVLRLSGEVQCGLGKAEIYIEMVRQGQEGARFCGTGVIM
jgi:hypothetical protein